MFPATIQAVRDNDVADIVALQQRSLPDGFRITSRAYRSALARLLCPETMRASVGFVARRRGRVCGAILGKSIQNPWRHTELDGCLYCAIVDARDRHLAPHLLQAFLDKAKKLRWTFLRSRLSIESAQDFGLEERWIQAFVEIRKQVSPASLPPPKQTDYVIRPAKPGDADFILERVAEGLLAGMTLLERATCAHLIEEAARSRIREVLSEPASILVAEREGVLVGQALVSFGLYNEVLGDIEAHIHDIIVLDTFRNLGIATHLSEVVERHVAATGLKAISATVCGDSEFSRLLLDRLSRSGWNPLNHCHVVRLDQL